MKRLRLTHIAATLLCLGAWLSPWLPIVNLGAQENPNQPQLSLSITPSHAFSWNGFEPATFTYQIRGIPENVVICTGWVYPVLQWYKDEWPMRRSCRETYLPFSYEQWGDKWPLTLIGSYIGFVELYSSFMALETGAPPIVHLEKTFQVLEGTPRY